MLQPTSPLRTETDIIKCVKKAVDNDLDAVWSISKIDSKYHPSKQLNIENNILNYYDKKLGPKIIRRQQLKETFIRNGIYYVFSRKTIMNENLLPHSSSYVVINHPAISIDTLDDIYEVKKYL